MNKAELIGSVAEKAGVSKKDAEKVVSALFGTVSNALKSGEKVQVIGFGTFYTRVLRERQGYNPVKGKSVKLPAVKIPAFKAGKTLKEGVR
ncbi:MAG: HU family DNA-binding protein [Bacillota bacterium]